MPYVDAAGLNTYYEEEGEGEPLLLLHGGLVTVDSWSAQRSALAERFHVYLPERRGHGRTPDVAGPLGFVLMARDTAAFMQAVGIDSAHFVGWSDGGVVALELALTRPELVRKLVLMGTAAHTDGYTDETREWNETWSVDDVPPYIREPYDRLSPDGPDHFPVVFNKLLAEWRTHPRHTSDELENITAPTLLMMGDSDVLTVEHAAAMRKAIPGSQLAIIPGADHFVPLQKPALVNSLLLDFLTTDGR